MQKKIPKQLWCLQTARLEYGRFPESSWGVNLPLSKNAKTKLGYYPKKQILFFFQFFLFKEIKFNFLTFKLDSDKIHVTTNTFEFINLCNGLTQDQKFNENPLLEVLKRSCILLQKHFVTLYFFIFFLNGTVLSSKKTSFFFYVCVIKYQLFYL